MENTFIYVYTWINIAYTSYFEEKQIIHEIAYTGLYARGYGLRLFLQDDPQPD